MPKGFQGFPFPDDLFAAAFSSCRSVGQKSCANKWKTIFSLCDDDGNGKRQAPELCHKLSDLGLTLNDEELDELFLDMDTNGDGTLDCDEFVAAMLAV